MAKIQQREKKDFKKSNKKVGSQGEDAAQPDIDFSTDLAALQDHSAEENDAPPKKKKKESSESLVATNTIFVSGLPYSATDADLEKFFEEVGPLRQCFVVKRSQEELEKNEGKNAVNRGIGYVHYALKEDAEKALSTLSKIKFMGRLLKLEFANRRPNKKERDGNSKVLKVIAPKAARHNPKPKTNEQESDRTLLLSNIPSSMGKSRLTKFLADLDIKPMGTFYKKGLARAVYETVELAQLASSRVQNQVADGQPLHGMILTNLLLKTKHARVIIRNLPFKLRELELEKLFDQFGPTIETFLPKKLDGSKQLLGFGFVQFMDRETAEKAVAGMNGTEHYGRKIDVSLCVSRAQYSASAENEQEPEEDETKPFKNSLYEDGEPEDVMESESEGEKSEEAESASEEEDEEEKPRDRKHVIPPECTLFVRNLLFETTDEDLFAKFSEFGKLRYARVVFDRANGRSKGTGFVSFVKPADARECLSLASQLEFKEEASKISASKSILVPEGPKGIAERFTLSGRLLLVTSSLSKEKSVEISGPIKNHAKEDRRNYYLLREGVIFPESAAGKLLAPKELERRKDSYNLRRKQLQANPSLFISKTRLSVRNLPLDLDDKGLRALVVSALDRFKAEVREGRRQHLTDKEKEEGWDKKLRVVQAKIVRSKGRIDLTTGLEKSTGFGFVEVGHHAHALAVLRYLNCNPNVFPGQGAQTSDTLKGRLLTVEFAVENKVVVKRRADRVVLRQKREAAQEKEAKRPATEEIDTRPAKSRKGEDKQRTYVNKKHAKKHRSRA
ncbi:RNA recognition motif-containing protein [Entomophthora muscae]|uniref:RNA recognition motif-containing protein n=1 Tax=Entomophthora muscae TaxID=34485 RepID=A0ACC2SWV2_9FUNG|nr:RNA recognition motif-containing protein [Entomophthora muscae]